MSILAQIGDRLGLRRHRKFHWQTVKSQRATTRERRRAAYQEMIAEHLGPELPPGTIVRVSDHRDGHLWVVTGRVPSVDDRINVRVVRADFPHLTSFVTSTGSLDVIGAATFVMGQKVRTGMDEGEIIQLSNDEALVRYGRRSTSLKGGGSLSHVNTKAWHPIWSLALENDPRLTSNTATLEN
jgi:hypothetical protein